MEDKWVIKKRCVREEQVTFAHQFCQSPIRIPSPTHAEIRTCSPLPATAPCVLSRSVSWPCTLTMIQSCNTSEVLPSLEEQIHRNLPFICIWVGGRETKQQAKSPAATTSHGHCLFGPHRCSPVSVQLLTVTQWHFRCRQEKKLFLTTLINNCSPWKPVA